MWNEEQILGMYDQPWRHYHNRDHITHMMRELSRFRSGLGEESYMALRLAILFHDAVWLPGYALNEEESIELFLRNPLWAEYEPLRDRVVSAIRATKAPFDPVSNLDKLMLYIDWSHFAGSPEKLHQVNINIFKEFQMHPFADYVVGRDAFLKLAETIPPKMVGGMITQAMVKKLISGIKLSASLSEAFRPRIGIYMGSFNPMHLGHEHIIRKAEKTLDKVIIVRAKNADKAGHDPYALPDFYSKYYQTFEADASMSAKQIIDSLVSDNADYCIVRGIRNGFDLTAEQTYMQHLRTMGVTLPVKHELCDIEFQHMSSSAVRQLAAVGVDAYRVP